MAKREHDHNITAFSVVQAATDEDTPVSSPKIGKNGGLKGGKARADSLSAERRSEIAREAAAARWSTK